jgi:hypothetical protein
VHAGYAFTDATFRTPLVLYSRDNPVADGEDSIDVQPGDRLPGVPRHRVVLSIDHASRRFSAGTTLAAQSGQIFTGDESNAQPRTQGFMIIGVHGSVALTPALSLLLRYRTCSIRVMRHSAPSPK